MKYKSEDEPTLQEYVLFLFGLLLISIGLLIIHPGGFLVMLGVVTAWVAEEGYRVRMRKMQANQQESTDGKH